MDLMLIIPTEKEYEAKERFDQIVDDLSKDQETEIIYTAEELEAAAEAGQLKNRRIIFAVRMDDFGINLEMIRMLRVLGNFRQPLKGSVGGIIVDGYGELYTKDTARKIVFEASMAGCTFPGKALVEATGSLNNFKVQAKNFKTTLAGAYKKSCLDLKNKVMDYQLDKIKVEDILVVHASSRKTSNSLALWNMVKDHLGSHVNVEEISIRDGEVWDCRGCKYEQCLHFGENARCFYGGVMVEKIYPAIKKCDAVVLICPNYNDSVSANIMAFINRLTALFRTNDFSSKKVFALVVSGYSGGDLVAQQILGAMNMNKNFELPAGFALMETANDPGTIVKIDNIEYKAADFAKNISGN